MSRPMTGAEVQRIRQLRAEGLTIEEVAGVLDRDRWTVWKYSSDENRASARKVERRTIERLYQDPERLERRRTQAREYMRKRRAKDHA